MAEKLPAGLPPGREMLLEFDGGNRRHVRLASLVHACDVWDQVELAERPGIPGLRLRTAGGDVRTGYDAFRYLVRALRLLWPLALLTFVPGVPALGRHWFPGSVTPTAPPSEGPPASGVVTDNRDGISPRVPLPPAD
jgi:hypothetical protein